MNNDLRRESEKNNLMERSMIDNFYVSPDEAKEEIQKRWNNKGLRADVEKFLGYNVPDPFRDAPRAFLARSIASPNKEAVQFLKTAAEIGIEPLFGEFLKDKFVSLNFDKYYLGKLFFYHEKDIRRGDVVSSDRVVMDMDGFEGHPIFDVKTFWGESLVDFHHRMFQEVIHERIDIFDLSEWIATQGGNAKEFYVKYLSLFLCHGVMIESFLNFTDSDRRFFDEVVVPAIDELENIFHHRPLIVRLFGDDHSATDIQTKCYFESVKKLIPE